MLLSAQASVYIVHLRRAEHARLQRILQSHDWTARPPPIVRLELCCPATEQSLHTFLARASPVTQLSLTLLSLAISRSDSQSQVTKCAQVALMTHDNF